MEVEIKICCKQSAAILMDYLLTLDAHTFNQKTNKGDIRLTLEEDDTKFYLGGSCLILRDTYAFFYHKDSTSAR